MTPFIRTDAEGNFLGRVEDKSSARVTDYMQALRDGAISVPLSEIAHHSNGTASGSLSNGDTRDVIAVSLVAGQTYTFAYRGTPTGGVEDPLLALFGPDAKIIDLDDDGGLGRSSMITYTATTTGNHFLLATSWYHVDPSAPGYPTYRDEGNYTIDIWSPAAAHDTGSTRATSTAIDEGTTFGYIDTVGDSDLYKVELTAGQVYTFTYNGGVAGGSDFDGATGESVGVLRLLNANGGTVVNYTVDFETGISFYAEQSGTYYLEARAYSDFDPGVPPMTGGYTLDIKEQSLSELDPLESLNWDSAANVPFVDVNGVKTAYVYFAPAGENFGETADDGLTPMTTHGWQQHQMDAVMHALTHYEHILGVKYEITTDASQATFRLMTTNSTQYGAYFYPQDADYGTQKGIGVFNLASGGFGNRPESLVQGGFSYAVILHEFGHAHGIAHPHDEGGGSEVMVGVTSPDSLGVFNLNQGVYTVMSYNDAWQLHPDGPTGNPETGKIGAVIDHGWSGSLSAFDIALLQKRYGVTEHATGDDTYALNDNYKTAYYQTIWDSGGIDAITYDGELNAQIDLTAATLDYSATGGGVVSFLYNSPQPNFTTEIKGGYTIANGVVIENASGGSGDDVLIGNAAANKLSGNAGDDMLIGSGGGDVLDGAAGFDTASYVTAAAGVNVTIANNGKITVTGGDVGDTLISIEAVEGSNHADKFTGGTNGDVFFGLGGDDNLSGGNGIDKLHGGAGVDKLDGGNGNDQLFGGAGVDTILGGTGNDIVDGGEGADVLTGGSGYDVFIFEDEESGDRIADFQLNVDKIDLSSLFEGPVTVQTVGSAAGALGAENTIYVYIEGTKTFVVANTDGDEGLDFGLELTGARKLKASDFITNEAQWDAHFTRIASPTDYGDFHL